MSMFFDSEEQTAVRLHALDILQRVLWSYRCLYVDDIIEHGLLPFLPSVANDRTAEVRRRGLEVVAKIVLQLPTAHFAKLAHLLDNIAWEDTSEAREIGVATLVDLLPFTLSRPILSDTLAVLELLIQLLHHPAEAVRKDIVGCLSKLRADKDYRIEFDGDPSPYVFCADIGLASGFESHSVGGVLPMKQLFEAIYERIDLNGPNSDPSEEVFEMLLDCLCAFASNHFIMRGIDVGKLCEVVASVTSSLQKQSPGDTPEGNIRRLANMFKCFQIMISLLGSKSQLNVYQRRTFVTCLASGLSIDAGDGSLVCSDLQHKIFGICSNGLSSCLVELPQTSSSLIGWTFMVFAKVCSKAEDEVIILSALEFMHNLAQLYSSNRINLTTDTFRSVLNLLGPFLRPEIEVSRIPERNSGYEPKSAGVPLSAPPSRYGCDFRSNQRKGSVSRDGENLEILVPDRESNIRLSSMVSPTASTHSTRGGTTTVDISSDRAATFGATDRDSMITDVLSQAMVSETASMPAGRDFATESPDRPNIDKKEPICHKRNTLNILESSYRCLAIWVFLCNSSEKKSLVVPLINELSSFTDVSTSLYKGTIMDLLYRLMFSRFDVSYSPPIVRRFGMEQIFKKCETKSWIQGNSIVSARVGSLGYAEMTIRRPTGTVSWLMALQNRLTPPNAPASVRLPLAAMHAPHIDMYIKNQAAVGSGDSGKDGGVAGDASRKAVRSNSVSSGYPSPASLGPPASQTRLRSISSPIEKSPLRSGSSGPPTIQTSSPLPVLDPKSSLASHKPFQTLPRLSLDGDAEVNVPEGESIEANESSRSMLSSEETFPMSPDVVPVSPGSVEAKQSPPKSRKGSVQSEKDLAESESAEYFQPLPSYDQDEDDHTESPPFFSQGGSPADSATASPRLIVRPTSSKVPIPYSARRSPRSTIRFTPPEEFTVKYTSVINAVSNFWRLVRQNEDDVSRTLMRSLAAAHPEYMKILSGDDDEKRKILMKKLSHLVSLFSDFPLLMDELRALGKLFRRARVSNQAFSHLWDALDEALRVGFGQYFNNRVRKSLLVVYEFCTNVLCGVYASTKPFDHSPVQIRELTPPFQGLSSVSHPPSLSAPEPLKSGTCQKSDSIAVPVYSLDSKTGLTVEVTPDMVPRPEPDHTDASTRTPGIGPVFEAASMSPTDLEDGSGGPAGRERREEGDGAFCDPTFVFMQLQDAMGGNFGAELRRGDILSRSLSVLDMTYPKETAKLGVLYVGKEQRSETEILGNSKGSSRYERFVRNLGEIVTLKGCNLYTGGMDTKHREDGDYTLIWDDPFTTIAFHVATLLPTDEQHKFNQNKKRHLGNDMVNIVYSDSPLAWEVDTIRTQLNFVHIVIYPMKDDRFRIIIKCKPGIPPFGPLTSSQIVSGSSLAWAVRQTALHADLACRMRSPCTDEITNTAEKTSYFATCHSRLQQIKQIGSRLRVVDKSASASQSTAPSPIRSRFSVNNTPRTNLSRWATNVDL
eukprot:7660_1